MNQILSISITFILWQAYAYMEGQREAYYYHVDYLSGFKFTQNLHGLFLTQRCFVYAAMILPCILTVWQSEMWIVIKWAQTAIVFVIYPLVFNFWRDGSYSCKRNDLMPGLYPKRWKAESNTSEAKHNATWKVRLEDFILGVLLFVGAIINVLINR